MNWYLGISGIVFAFLFLVWTAKDWKNLTFKTVFFILMMWSAFLNLQVLGYVVKL